MGTLFVQPGTKFDNIFGADVDGVYKIKASARYSAKFAMQLSIAVLGSLNATKHSVVAKLDKSAEPATDDMHPVGSRVELYWFVDKESYRGTVMNSRVRKGMVHGMSINRREIQVRYDADEALLWHAVCNYAVRSAPAEESSPKLMVLAAIAARSKLVKGDSTLHMLDGDVCDDPGEGDPDELASYVGHVFSMRDISLDMETGEALDSSAVYAVLGDSSVVKLDFSNAHTWHVPANEREYNISPQRDLWRTAKELKMDNYSDVDMFDLELESSVDETKYKIYDTLWVLYTGSSTKRAASCSRSSILGGASRVVPWIARCTNPTRR